MLSLSTPWKIPLAIDHHELVGLHRQRLEQAQVAEHRCQPHIGPDFDLVGVHQATGRILRVGEHRLELSRRRPPVACNSFRPCSSGKDWIRSTRSSRSSRWTAATILVIHLARSAREQLVVEITEHLARHDRFPTMLQASLRSAEGKDSSSPATGRVHVPARSC